MDEHDFWLDALLAVGVGLGVVAIGAAKAAWMLPTPPVQAIARGRLPRPSQPCVARPARGASGGKVTIYEPV